MAGRLAVLVSGTGTILEALYRAGLTIALVGADRPCRGLEIAQEQHTPTALWDRAAFGGFRASFDRVSYSETVATSLVANDIDIVAMAGFGTVLAPPFFDVFSGRVLNTHPSLLPAFKGWHAVADALAAGVTETGCTVHLATAQMDEGPLLQQVRVPVVPGDDEHALHERIKEAERVLYPAVLGRVMSAWDQGILPVDACKGE